LERQQTSCTSLYFPKTPENSKDFDPEDEGPQFLEDLQVRAWLIQKHSDQNAEDSDSETGEDTEYEEELTFDRNSGAYRSGLIPGTYLILADGEGFQSYSETIDIQEGDFSQEMIMQKKQAVNAIVVTQDGITGENLSGVIIRFKKKTSRHVCEGVTEEMACIFQIDSTGCYQVEAERKGYINARQEFYYTKMNQTDGQQMVQFNVIMMPVGLPPLQKSIIAQDGNELPPMTKLRVIIDIADEHLRSPP
jgi:hypothetical protein